MKKNNNIFGFILYFLFLTLFSSFCIFSQLGAYYSFMIQNQNNIKEEIEEIPEKEENTNDNKKNNTLKLIETTTAYKIYVDIETRNMYLKNNSYSTKQNDFVLMYNGTEPKIFDGEINGETYEDFLAKQQND